MKYIKSYNESIFDIFKPKINITNICKKYGIENYTINEDGSVDVEGNVDLRNNNLSSIFPFQFNIVTGNFRCFYNKLKTLEGCPKTVGGTFNCRSNRLKTLKGAPESVGGGFYCGDNKLTSFEGCPKSVGSIFDCHKNNISSFESFNQLPFENFENLINGFLFQDNPVWNIWESFKDFKAIDLFNYYDIIRDNNVIILDRLNCFLEEIGKKPITDVKGYKCI